VNLFTPGNDKVGNALVFNLPVFKTCPGSTLFCRTYCYGDWFNNRWPDVKRKHEANYQSSLRPDFPALAVAELEAAARRRRLPHPRLCRVHSVGDFYGAEYIRKWVEIATAAPEWTFWAYTRTWRVPDLLPELERLAMLPNFWLWLSADFMTKLPPEVPGARGVAWMQYIGESLDWMKTTGRGREAPRMNDLLIFPVKEQDRQPVKRIGLGMVCPHYNGTPKDKVPTCEGCRFCFTASRGVGAVERHELP
jgi:hypothetical protein